LYGRGGKTKVIFFNQLILIGGEARDMGFLTGNVVVQKKLLMITSRLRNIIWKRFEEPRK